MRSRKSGRCWKVETKSAVEGEAAAGEEWSGFDGGVDEELEDEDEEEDDDDWKSLTLVDGVTLRKINIKRKAHA